jgi:hypothetical protein
MVIQDFNQSDFSIDQPKKYWQKNQETLCQKMGANFYVGFRGYPDYPADFPVFQNLYSSHAYKS